VKAGALDVGGQLHVGGAVAAELVVIDGTGTLAAGRGTKARLFVLEGYDHHVHGTVAAKRVDFAKAPARGVKVLAKLLAALIDAWRSGRFGA
jgi:hypothetical protein